MSGPSARGGIGINLQNLLIRRTEIPKERERGRKVQEGGRSPSVKKEENPSSRKFIPIRGGDLP